MLAASLVAAVALAILIGARPLATGAQGLEGRADLDAGAAPRGDRGRAAAAGPMEARSRPIATSSSASTFAAQFQNDKEALVYTTGSSMRSDTSGPGYWVFTPARLGDGRTSSW